MKQLRYAKAVELEISASGIHQIRPYRVTIPWQAVVQMSTNRQGTKHNLYVSTAREQRALVVLLDFLDKPAEDVVRAIRYYSQNCFPDYYDKDRFPLEP